MSKSGPPRRLELLLEAVGADTDYATAAIGDLAEEFASRAARLGESAAWRWYYRESARVVPHLAWSWVRSLRPRDAVPLTNTVALALLCLVAFEGFGQLTVRSFAVSVGVHHVAFPSAGSGFIGFVLPTLLLLWTALDGVFGGYVTTVLSRRAPFAATLVVCPVWAMMCSGAARFGVLSSLPPAWFRTLNLTVLAAGFLVGGLWRVVSARTQAASVAT